MKIYDKKIFPKGKNLFNGSYCRGKAGTLFVFAILCGFLSARENFTQTGAPPAHVKRQLLPGAWHRRGFSYMFADSGIFEARRTGSPDQSLKGEYVWFRLGGHDCIAFRNKRPGDDFLEIFLIGRVTDSSAIIALGTPFIRADSSRGLAGLWKHQASHCRIEWRFGPGTASYRKTEFDSLSGSERITEERSGSYSKSDDPEPGSFTVLFDDGNLSSVLPVVHRDMMCLFDLSPAKSLFSRGMDKQTSHMDQIGSE